VKLYHDGVGRYIGWPEGRAETERRCLKMQTLVVDLILAAGVCAIFLIALRGGKDEKG
jgi:hypothetical protein